MPSDEIETGNYGGVGRLPAARAARVLSEDLDYLQPQRSLRLVRRSKNLPALLSCIGGAFALLLTGGVTLTFDSRLGPGLLDAPLLLASCGIAVVSFFVGVLGLFQAAFEEPGRGGWWSILGIAIAMITAIVALYVFAVYVEGGMSV